MTASKHPPKTPKAKSAAAASGGETLTGRPCPICGRPGLQAEAPFCSGRCAQVDLNRWLTESYRIPVAPPGEGDEEDEGGGGTPPRH